MKIALQKKILFVDFLFSHFIVENKKFKRTMGKLVEEKLCEGKISIKIFFRTFSMIFQNFIKGEKLFFQGLGFYKNLQTFCKKLFPQHFSEFPNCFSANYFSHFTAFIKAIFF